MNDQAFLEAKIFGLENEVCSLKATLRDCFAQAALTGYLSSFEPMEDPSEYSSSIAIDCYRLADAMLEARKS